ncbi:uncharacterized protein LOC141902066 [Tubulanus polymorphus]|uniref:uncharacterized protein LOC141902066 n=1 Tax=Tubulanus polymorphus TaxID=672921 RepID=UPI003DA6AC91
MEKSVESKNYQKKLPTDLSDLTTSIDAGTGIAEDDEGGSLLADVENDPEHDPAKFEDVLHIIIFTIAHDIKAKKTILAITVARTSLMKTMSSKYLGLILLQVLVSLVASNELHHVRNGLVTIHGTVGFPGDGPPSFPENTHMYVSLSDDSMADGKSIVLHKMEVDLNDHRAGRPITYTMTVPPSSGSLVTISVVVNVGWEPEGGDWIHKGDYLTTTSYRVDFTKGNNIERNVAVERI